MICIECETKHLNYPTTSLDESSVVGVFASKHPRKEVINVLMTQVSYWTLQENKRHNLATEELGRDNLSEMKRHNVVSEDVSYKQLQETQRHNIRTENLNAASIAETSRHNQQMEAIGFENAAANTANAASTARNVEVNLFNAETQRSLASTRKYEADTSRMQAESNIKRNEAGIWQDWISTGVDAYSAFSKASTERQKVAQGWFNTLADFANPID